jgi:hypothetical protein
MTSSQLIIDSTTVRDPIFRVSSDSSEWRLKLNINRSKIYDLKI